MDILRKGAFVYFIARARIDYQRMVRHDDIGILPSGEGLPVVRTDDECELSVGMCLAELLQSVDHVRWARQVEFKVRGMELGIFLYRQAYQFQTELIIPQVR